MSLTDKLTLPTAEQALPGREQTMLVPDQHYVLGTPLTPPFESTLKQIQFGMGCFWGAERKFWQAQGVFTTAVGYSGGITPNPTYEEVCSGGTGHVETVLVVYNPDAISTYDLFKLFWEGHDPTQGMRQGNDLGTQYRSCVYTYDDEQREALAATQAQYQAALTAAGYGAITTETAIAPAFYYAEHYHQTYLAKVPNGY